MLGLLLLFRLLIASHLATSIIHPRYLYVPLLLYGLFLGFKSMVPGNSSYPTFSVYSILSLWSIFVPHVKKYASHYPRFRYLQDLVGDISVVHFISYSVVISSFIIVCGPSIV
jgi:hypothetical protein